MTPSEIGDRAEIAVMAALADAGQRVLVPFGGHHRYDLAFEYRGRLVKVQCKDGREKNGVVVLRTCNTTRHGERRDYRGDVDVFGVYCHTRNEVYLVPVSHVPRRIAHLRLRPPRNNQGTGIRMAAQYLIRDGRLPDAVDQALGAALTPVGSTRGHIRGSRPTRITSSPLDRQMWELAIDNTYV